MLFKVAAQSNPFLSRRFRVSLLAAATFGLPFCGLAQAQVGEIVIGTPPKPAPVPDPPVITTEELSKLIGGPTLVNYVGTDVPTKEVIRSLTTTVKDQPFSVSAEGAVKPISVNWQDMPFWEAASQVEELADGRFIATGSGLPYFSPYDRVRDKEIEPGLNGLLGLGAETPLVKVVAPTLNRVLTSKILVSETERDGAATTDEIQLVMNAYFDPKVKATSVQVRQLKFQSKPNAPVMDGSGVFKGVNGMVKVENFSPAGALVARRDIYFPAGMAIAPKSRFYRISGILHTVVAMALESWKIPDLLTAGKVTRTIAGGQYSIENVETKNNALVLNFTFPSPASQNDLAMQFMSMGSRPLRVRDAQGRELRMTSINVSKDNGTTKCQLDFSLKNYKNEDMVGPYPLEWTIPTQERSYDVPFEFRDVPMP